MKILISGGCKNGKTGFAQNIAVKLSKGGKRYYVATMVPFDEEDRARIARHIAERNGLGFETLEWPRDIGACPDAAAAHATLLVDSVTALLLNEMYPDPETPEPDPDAVDRCRNGLLRVAKNAQHAIFISDYLYADAARYDPFTERFRASLAALDRMLAAQCDVVIELCAGNVIFHKGGIAL